MSLPLPDSALTAYGRPAKAAISAWVKLGQACGT